MKKVLFIDRDGTLILEPEDNQVDALEKLVFFPGVFRNLYKIAQHLDYKLVIVTNQDGLGTTSFPEEDFLPPQEFMLKTFENEGIVFDEVVVDKTFAHENAPTRKPRTGLLEHYLDGSYDLAHSFVIGDRLTDVELAKNLGAKAIWINTQPELGVGHTSETLPSLSPWIALTTQSWDEIADFLFAPERKSSVKRKTKETDIEISLVLDGNGQSEIDTGIGFFDHMLDQLARHSGCDLKIHVNGDLHIDEHHTIEDTAIALGEAFLIALGNKRGIERYGFQLPMDDCLASVSLDFGGRPWLVWDASFQREMIGGMPTEMFFHFFKSFADSAKMNLNIKAEGTNEHHKIESIFKCLAKAIKMAIYRNPLDQNLPTTKGIL